MNTTAIQPLDEFGSVIYIARIIYQTAEFTGCTSNANLRLGRIADTLRDDTGTRLHQAARTAALDELHAWALVEHADRGHLDTVTCVVCCTDLPAALIADCDHGYGPTSPEHVAR